MDCLSTVDYACIILAPYHCRVVPAYFVATDPAQVRNLTASHSVVSQGDAVDFTCLWENGNPPTSVRLMNYKGVEVEIDRGNRGELRHKIHNVSWHDAGTWTCQTLGSIENKTITLTVKSECKSRTFV